jgi:hypothetical protein
MKKRIIKVEEAGDRGKNNIFPRIRLKGHWLKDAGMIPNRHVNIYSPRPGELILRLKDE